MHRVFAFIPNQLSTCAQVLSFRCSVDPSFDASRGSNLPFLGSFTKFIFQFATFTGIHRQFCSQFH
jgi:hypothetical protein